MNQAGQETSGLAAPAVPAGAPPPPHSAGSSEGERASLKVSSPEVVSPEAQSSGSPTPTPAATPLLVPEVLPDDNAGGSPQPSVGNTTQTHAHTIGSTQSYQGQQQTITNNYNYGPDPKAAASPQQGQQQTVINNYSWPTAKAATAPQQEDTPVRLEPLPRRPEALKSLRIEIPAELVRGPEKHRIILISAFRQEISLAAAYSLIESTSLSSYTAQALVLDSAEHRNNKNINIDLFNSQSFQGRRDEVVVVDIDREGVFLDSLRNISLLHASRLGERLRERDTVVVCSLTTQTRDRISCDAFFHWAVDFLPAALLMRFPKEEVERLHAILEEQQRLNLWGATREDYYQQIWGYLQRGGDALKSEIERRQGFTALSLSESVDKIQFVKPRDVFRADSAPHAAACYISAYFPGLTPQDFDFLVRAILGEQATTVEGEEQNVNRQGMAQVRRKRIEKKWAEIWQEDSDRILRDCRLEGVVQGGGTHVIEFVDPYLRKELRTYLEASHPMFVLRTFGRLLQLGLLFSPTVSSTISDLLIHLTVERTISDPSYFGKDRLLLFVIGMGSNLDATSSVGEALARLALQEHFYDRLSQLMREMLQHTSLHTAVRGFLENLLEIDAAIAQDLLFGLLDRLRFEPQFQGLAWIRSLLDRTAATGNGDVRIRIYNRLVAFALGSGPRVYSVLKEIAGWLPEPEQRRYSPSNGDALRLLGDYCFYSLGRLPSDSRGEWPSQYDLFTSLSLDPAATAERVGKLADWLTHPGMKHVLALDPAFGDLRNNPERLFLTVIAYFVEEWLLILEGVGPKAPVKEASALADQLLRAVAARLDESHRRELVRGWQTRQQGYVQEINRLPVQQRSQREHLKTRRRKLLELQQRFQSLPTDRGTTRRRNRS